MQKYSVKFLHGNPFKTFSKYFLKILNVFLYNQSFFSRSKSSISGFPCFKNIYIYTCKKNYSQWGGGCQECKFFLACSLSKKLETNPTDFITNPQQYFANNEDRRLKLKPPVSQFFTVFQSVMENGLGHSTQYTLLRLCTSQIHKSCNPVLNYQLFGDVVIHIICHIYFNQDHIDYRLP